MKRILIIAAMWAAGCGAPGAGADGGVDAGLKGLGQLCGLNNPECPTEAPRCLVMGSGSSLTGVCSKLCVESGTFDTDAQSQPDNISPALSTGNDTCAALYTGTVGNSECRATLDVIPADEPLKPNAQYTFKAGCVIRCGALNACPGNLKCDPELKYCLAP